MAPSATTTTQPTSHTPPTKATTNNQPTKPIDLSLFPDGHKTTGQHPPLYHKLHPYSSFPKVINAPTLWHPEDYATQPSQWTHQFTPLEIAELSTAADTFISSNLPLTGITKCHFPLPHLTTNLQHTRSTLLTGRGFQLYKGLPVREWGTQKSAVAYLGLSTHVGHFVSQNGRGHVLGHVKDLGEDATRTDSVRIYRTNARQFFHADDCDVVGLLCLSRAQEGGESDLASFHLVWNLLQRERPDVAELLTRPVWYFDRKGEVSWGEEGWIRSAVVFLEDGGQGRVYCKWDPYYVRSLGRFVERGLVPGLSEEQEEAVRVLEETCQRVKLHMVLEVGDVQFVSNSHTLHARTEYRDYAADSGMPRRHLMRLWLSTPVSEGGWDLPFWDNDEKKRGGVQVNDTPPVARLDAD